MSKRGLVAAALLAFAIGVHCQTVDGVSEIIVRKTDKAPVIDGALADPVWRDAARASPLIRLGGGREAVPGTIVRICYDDQALYLGVEALVADISTVTAPRRDHDAEALFGDDVLELFVDADLEPLDYHHFVVSASGGRMDLLHKRGQQPGESIAWTPLADWPVAVAKQTDRWTAELALPWATFGASAPQPGDAWRFKLGRNGPVVGTSMWPANPTGSFHSRIADAMLYFGRKNLLPNGDFEQWDKATGLPVGWRAVITTAETGPEPQGEISTSSATAQSGSRSVTYRKTVQAKWYPYLVSPVIPVVPGATYEMTAWAKGSIPIATRVYLFDPKTRFGPTRVTLTGEWQKISHVFTAPTTAHRMHALFSATDVTGEAHIDNVSIHRSQTRPSMGARPPRAHPIHNLAELARRRRFKPYDLVRHGDVYQGERTIFRDSATGAEIWKMSHEPNSTRHDYSEMTPWNLDGSRLLLRSSRPGRTVLLPAGGASLRTGVSAGPWSRLNGHEVFRFDRDTESVCVTDVLTGKTRKLFTIPDRPPQWGVFLPPVSRDGKRLLAILGHQNKIKTPPTSFGYIIDTQTGTAKRFDFAGNSHQVWFTKDSNYTVAWMYESNQWDDDPGYYNGEWHMNPYTGKRRQYLPKHFGHRAYAPGGGQVACQRNGMTVFDLASGKGRVVYPQSGGHTTWGPDPDWFAATTRLPITMIYPEHENWFQQIAITNAKLFQSNYWCEAHLDLSPDGTKIGYASNMLGDIDFYQVVARRPDPPTGLSGQRAAEGVKLSWSPGEYHAETRGYHVFRSSASGGGWQQVTQALTAQTTFVDAVPPVSETAYVVAAMEHSGLPSRYSAEALVPAVGSTRWRGPVVVVCEAEQEEGMNPWWGPWFLPGTAGDDRCAAMRAPGVKIPLKLALDVPSEGVYSVWLRVGHTGVGGEMGVSVDGDQLGSTLVDWPELRWIRLSQGTDRRLAAGRRRLSISALEVGLLVDQICLATDTSFRPSGRLGVDRVPPAPVNGLRSECRRFDVSLSWQPAKEPDLHHYNVYCRAGDDPGADQQFLVHSPGEPALVDWGLQAGTAYHYRVTAVDRQGNESAPSAVHKATTMPIDRVLVQLQAQATWPRGDTLQIPFELPAAGEYAIWVQTEPAERTRSGRSTMDWRLDENPWQSTNLWFDITCKGHSGSIPGTAFWDLLRGWPARQSVKIGAGKHTLALKATKIRASKTRQVIITNDLGYEPKGMTSWLGVDVW